MTPEAPRAATLLFAAAATFARTAVAAQQARLVFRQVVVPPNDRARPPGVVVPFRLVPVVGGFTHPPVRIREVATRATATVTYTIQP